MHIPLVFKSFEGGWSTDPKMGIKNSFAYSQSIDFRKSPSQMTVLPGPSREDTNVVSDLLQNEVMVDDGTIYAIGSLGNFYKRTTAGVWSREADIGTGYYGLDYRKDTDSIYVAGAKYVSRLSKVSGSSVFLPNYYGPSYSTYDNSTTMGFYCAAFQNTGTTTYTTPTAISERSVDIRYFQTDIEPLTKISVFVVAKGTGDWTLTLHDGTNTVLGTSTVTTANLVSGTLNDFVFSSATNGQVRVYPAPNARTYHLHITSTVADGTARTTVINDFSTADLEVWADRLVQSTNGIHPIERFQQFECIGNSNYVSVWEPISDPPTNAEWQRHKLVFPMEYEVCGMTTMNEYLVIATERVASSTTNTPQEGIIFFWDGLSDTYNYFVKIPEGAPYGIHSHKNIIYYFAGTTWYAIGSPTTQPVKLRQMPGTITDFTGATVPIRINPYASTVRRGTHLMAFPSYTTSSTLQYGVYSYGAVDKNFPQSFGLSYIMSTGSQFYSAQNNLQIGMVKSFGDTLHISWRDDLNGGYGVDVVNNTSSPASSSSWQSLIFDNGRPTKEKKAMYMKVSFLPLPDGASVGLKYQINRGSWSATTTFTNTSLYKSFTNIGRVDIPSGNFFEIQLGLDITCTTSTPTITSVELMFDDARDDEDD